MRTCGAGALFPDELALGAVGLLGDEILPDVGVVGEPGASHLLVGLLALRERVHTGADLTAQRE